MSELISLLWADELMPGLAMQNELWRKQAAELQWLRKSLEDDMLPDWCIEMVMADWQKEHLNEWVSR